MNADVSALLPETAREQMLGDWWRNRLKKKRAAIDVGSFLHSREATETVRELVLPWTGAGLMLAHTPYKEKHNYRCGAFVRSIWGNDGGWLVR